MLDVLHGEMEYLIDQFEFWPEEDALQVYIKQFGCPYIDNPLDTFIEGSLRALRAILYIEQSPKDSHELVIERVGSKTVEVWCDEGPWHCTVRATSLKRGIDKLEKIILGGKTRIPCKACKFPAGVRA